MRITKFSNRSLRVMQQRMRHQKNLKNNDLYHMQVLFYMVDQGQARCSIFQRHIHSISSIVHWLALLRQWMMCMQPLIIFINMEGTLKFLFKSDAFQHLNSFSSPQCISVIYIKSIHFCCFLHLAVHILIASLQKTKKLWMLSQVKWTGWNASLSNKPGYFI